MSGIGIYAQDNSEVLVGCEQADHGVSCKRLGPYGAPLGGGAGEEAFEVAKAIRLAKARDQYETTTGQLQDNLQDNLQDKYRTTHYLQ